MVEVLDYTGWGRDADDSFGSFHYYLHGTSLCKTHTVSTGKALMPCECPVDDDRCPTCHKRSPKYERALAEGATRTSNRERVRVRLKA